jgi:hypothetical protein
MGDVSRTTVYHLKKRLTYRIVKFRNEGGWAKFFMQKERDIFAVL